MITFDNVWKTLSGVSVKNQIRQKNDLNYLPWSWAWGVMMEYYPEAVYSFAPPKFYEDGSCEVWVTVSIGKLKRKMWLPVMNYKGISINNPSSKDISNARMRALVKCLAMFGLGHYIYAGEELPEIRGQTTGALLDFDTIKKAYQFFKSKIDADTDDFDYLSIQDAERNLQSMNVDYMVEVMTMFGTEKCESSPRKRQYKNILADALKVAIDADGQRIVGD